MLQIRHLTVTHRQDLRTILDDFSFILRKGDKAAVIGEEGNGKSTLLKLIYREDLVRGYAEYTGDIIKGNARFGYLAQELAPEQNGQSVAAFFSGNPAFLSRPPREICGIAARLGLNSGFFGSGQTVGTLSGGEKVKLQLAAILMEEPDALLLDEPSNDLDIEALEWLERFIRSCSVPVMFISHDETLLENTANVIIHLEQVRRKTRPRYTVGRMSYRQYVDGRLSMLSHQEQIARKERSEYERQQEKFRRIQSKVEHQLETITRADPHGAHMLKKKMKAVKSMGRRFEREHETMTPVPDAEEAILMKFPENAAVPAGKTVLDFQLERLTAGNRTLSRDIKLTVKGGEKICITGRNGAGKTTLLRIIAKILAARKDLNAAYMPQDYEELLNSGETPVEFLSKDGGKDEITKIRSFLGSARYTADEMERGLSGLSGGQKAKLLFLKMIFGGSDVLILDEPTRNFSPLSNPVIREILKLYGGTIVSVSHDRKFIGEVCGKVYRLTEAGLSGPLG